MNYQKIYNQIIERADNRAKTRKEARETLGYSERHHVVPKCMKGSNHKENLRFLTAKEHFLCHLLLCEIYPNNYKLKQAIFLMSNIPVHKVSARLYERLKKEYSISISGINNPGYGKSTLVRMIEKYGEEEAKIRFEEYRKNLSKAQQNRPPVTKEVCEIISKAKKGKKQSESHHANVLIANAKKKGTKLTEEHQKKISENCGTPCTEERKQRIGAANKGKEPWNKGLHPGQPEGKVTWNKGLKKEDYELYRQNKNNNK